MSLHAIKLSDFVGAACPQSCPGVLARGMFSAIAGLWLGSEDRVGLRIAAKSLLVRFLASAISRRTKIQRFISRCW